jgi:putative MATE family efflux protein
MSDPRRLLALSPFRAILALAAPTTAVMVVGATSNILHTFFVSRLGAEAIAAVSLVYPINLILWTVMGGGVGTGVSSAIAHALGGGRPEEASSIAEHAFLLTAIIGVVFTFGMLLGGPAIYAALGGHGETLALAITFAQILFAGSLVTFTIATLDAIYRGEGNVRVPTICSTVSLGLQIALTPLFMFGFGWGIAGAASAAIVGQAIGGVPRVIYLRLGRGALRPGFLPARPTLAPIAEILRVGIPASIATLVNYVGLLALTAVVGRHGMNEIAAFGLGTRLDFIMMTIAYGTGSAVLTLTSLAAGAGDTSRVRAVVLRGLGLVASILVVVSLVLYVRPDVWLGLFTDEPAILEVGRTYLRTLAPSYPFLGAAMILAFAFQGLRRAVLPLAVMSVRVTVVVAAALFASGAGAPVTTIFAIMAGGNLLSSALLYWRLHTILEPA